MTKGRTISLLLVAVGACAASPAQGSPGIPGSGPVRAPCARCACERGSTRAATLTGTVRTGRHFNVVGLRWRGDAVASLSVRVRSGRGWGRWTDVPVEPRHRPDVGNGEPREASGRGSDPVWAGQANAVQYRLRGEARVRDLRFEFVNTEGTATAAGRRAGGARASIARPIAPAPGVPGIVTRDQWGASSARRARPPPTAR